MKIIWQLTMRNMRIYYRNKTTVFFSCFSMLIIIGLYALFLGDAQVNQLKAIIDTASEEVRWLVNSWIMGGILTVNAVTITLATLNVMVEDKERKYIKDFIVAPIKRWYIAISYILASIIIGIIMTILSFGVAELYIVINGGHLLDLVSTIKVIVGIVLSVVAIASAGFWAYSYIKSEKTLSTISNVIGTLIGFITGVYIPIGVMPNIVQRGIKLFPITYSATIFKGIMIAKPVERVFAKTGNEALQGYNVMMGNTIFIKGYEVSYIIMLGILIITAITFFILSILRITNQRNYD